MPGNEVGDRIHNFLGQEGLSQGQHHRSQILDTAWPGLSNNPWVGNQRQVGGPLVSSLKNFSVHQLAESDRGYNSQSSSRQHDLNFTQSGLRPEIARSQLQNQSTIANGYLLGQQALHARQNETNFLGVDTASRSLSPYDSQIGNGPDFHKKNLSRLESTESPVNYDFFGGQQQISSQHSGMIQSLQRQQSGMNDMHLLQQHAVLKQLQDLQRQQLLKPEFQLPDARQLSSGNQVSSSVTQGMGSLSPAPINGVPVHDASNFSWQPEHMSPNANWMQHGASPSMHVSCGGFTFSSEQGQVGLVPQQIDQSFYGTSTGGTRGNPYQHSSVQIDKPSMQQVPVSSNSFPGNQYAVFSDQVGLQDGTSVFRHGDQGKNVFGASSGQGLNTGFHSESLQQMTIQPQNSVMRDSCGRQEHPGLSEISVDKSVIQAAPSQSVATLDETEEKILFGSDDNVWDMFGKSTNMGSLLDGTDSFGALPSLQSGSWSALMQSAVAETSSNDLGVQEEGGGFGVQNIEPSSGNMPSQIVNDDSKHQLTWADNNLQTALTSNSKPFSMSSDANINLDFFSIPGVQQSGVQIANEQTGKMHNDSSQKFVQQLTEERGKHLDCNPLQKPVAESVQCFGNAAHSPNVRVSAKSIPGHQQGISVHNLRVQPHNKPNGWNFIESASHSGDAISKSQDIDCALQPSQNSDHRGAMYDEKGHGSALDHPVHDANIEWRNKNSCLGSPRANRGVSDLDNVAVVTDSRTTRVTGSSQQLPNKHNLNLRKNQNQDKNPQTFGSPGNDCLDKGAPEANILENSNVKETSSDSFHLNSSHHSTTGGMRDNVWLDVNDPHGGKQKSSVHISHKPSGIRKFQYHPMGDLDVEVEPSYGTKSVAHSQAISQHVSQGLKDNDRGYFGQSKITGHAAQQSIETEKGCFPGTQVDEVPSRSSDQGSASDKSFVGSVPNKTAPMSQNMLELLPKFDQPREYDTVTHLSSSKHNLSSEMPDTETSDGSIGQFQHIRPSTSQCVGLQLGLPSQRFTIPDCAISSQALPASQPSATSESPKQGAFHKMPDAWNSVSAPQHLLGAQSSWASQDLFKYHQSNINSERTLPGTKKLDDHITEAGGSGQSELPAGSAKPHSFEREEQPAKDQQNLPGNDANQNPATMPLDIGALGHSLPNNTVHQNLSLLQQVQSMKDIEIEPSNRSVKRFKGPSLESALDTQRVSSEGAEQLSYGSDTMMKEALVNRPLVPSGDPKIPRLLLNTSDNCEAQVSSNNMLALAQNDSRHFSSANNPAPNPKGGHSQISPQMAPSWFDRYGTFKNEQISPLYDARKIAMVKAADKAFIGGRSSDSSHALHSSEQVNAAADVSQPDSACKSSKPMASEPVSSHSLPPDITNQDLVVVRARKRKSMTFELLPWHREVTQVSQRSQNISVAEMDWVHAANRLIEKVEDEAGMIEDWPPVVRSKRRLILTRQLMQQLLRAPPRVFLSADASKNYETVFYFVARSVSGDACSTACISESDTVVHLDSESTLSGKLKGRNQSTLKAAEDFIIRAKKLENYLQSLDKRTSILDLRLECQDLEKISVINRFAKLHGRGQADGAETSSSTGVIARSHKFFFQRYVIALPMPRNLPDRVQCLSL